MPPCPGQVQVAESEHARVLTMDVETRETHFQYAASSYRWGGVLYQQCAPSGFVPGFTTQSRLDPYR